MKQTRNIARRWFASILVLLMATLTLESVVLAGVDPTWIPTGSLNIARRAPTATLLPNGKVLVVGGWNGTALNSAELYDPATGTWSLTGNLNRPRFSHTATLLPNGKVLVAGGSGDTSAELYDPATNTWSLTGDLSTARAAHTATLLTDGRVLVAGGSTAELYDPVTGAWSVTGDPITVRFWPTATLLQNGKVLIVGGLADDDVNTILPTAELYDPATGTWSITGSLNVSRYSFTTTLLPNGKVLAAGGYLRGVPAMVNPAGPQTSLNSAELYDPATGTWSIAASLNMARDSHTATLLPNGKVLVAAGGYWTPPCGDACSYNLLSSAELYDPAGGTWSSTAGLNTARGGATATRLQNGQVLIAGGSNGSGVLNSAELYDSPVQLVAAVLPSSRSVQVGTPATAFATIINTDSNMATGCTISRITDIPATLTYRTTDPATNQVIGAPSAPVDISPGAAQSFVFALTPTAPMAPTDIQLSFDCANTDPAPIISGLNTLLFSASATPTPDLLALVATPTNDGIVNISGTNGVGAFAVAAVNVGAGDTLTVSADAGGAALPVNISICQTDPKTSDCLSPPANSVTTMILTNETPTFGVFVAAQEDISFFPETNRIFVRFKDSGGVTRGLTSVAVRTQ